MTILAWRSWAVSGCMARYPSGTLRALTLDAFAWHPGTNAASCVYQDPNNSFSMYHNRVHSRVHSEERVGIPNKSCSCGFYASKSSEMLNQFTVRFEMIRAPTFSLIPRRRSRYDVYSRPADPWHVEMDTLPVYTVYPLVPIRGIVELWGKVIPGKYGYRAQFARPVALIADVPPFHQLLPMIEQAYLVQTAISKMEFYAPYDTMYADIQESAQKAAIIYGIPLLPSIDYADKEYFT